MVTFCILVHILASRILLYHKYFGKSEIKNFQRTGNSVYRLGNDSVTNFMVTKFYQGKGYFFSVLLFYESNYTFVDVDVYFLCNPATPQVKKDTIHARGTKNIRILSSEHEESSKLLN